MNLSDFGLKSSVNSTARFLFSFANSSLNFNSIREVPRTSLLDASLSSFLKSFKVSLLAKLLTSSGSVPEVATAVTVPTFVLSIYKSLASTN